MLHTMRVQSRSGSGNWHAGSIVTPACGRSALAGDPLGVLVGRLQSGSQFAMERGDQSERGKRRALGADTECSWACLMR